MDIPAYVPEGVRTHSLSVIDGYEAKLKNHDLRLPEIKFDLAELAKLSHALPPSSPELKRHEDKLASLRLKETQCITSMNSFVEDIACIKRLIFDPRMKDVYQALAGHFFDLEEQEKQDAFIGFISAARTAKIDATPAREQIKNAMALKNEIANTANSLAKCNCSDPPLPDQGLVLMYVRCGHRFVINQILTTTVIDDHTQTYQNREGGLNNYGEVAKQRRRK